MLKLITKCVASQDVDLCMKRMVSKDSSNPSYYKYFNVAALATTLLVHNNVAYILQYDDVD